MPQRCKGTCQQLLECRYDLDKEVRKYIRYGYLNGYKRCSICEIFIKWDGLWCPCCGYRLRTKPRNLKYKAKLRARNKTVEPLEQAIVIQ